LADRFETEKRSRRSQTTVDNGQVPGAAARAGTLTLAVFAAALVSGTSGPVGVHAQESTTCGWHFLDEVDVPPVLGAVLEQDSGMDRRITDAAEGLLRWYRHCDHTAARQAAQSLRLFQQRTNSSDPVLRALLAISLLRGPDLQVARAEGVSLRAASPESNAEREGVRLLTEVVRRTRWSWLAHDLAEISLATRRKQTLADAAQTLRAIIPTAADASLSAALAEVELARGDHAAAISAARPAVSAGNHRGMRALGLALMLSAADPTPGAALYLKGMGGAPSAAVHRYFDDLRVILGADELEQWRSLPPTERTAWLARKWEWRSLVAGITVAERLAEHFRRLDHATKVYPKSSYRGAPAKTAVWRDALPSQMPFDDRGIIYVRHGPPDAELRMAGNQSMRLGWGYHALGGRGTIFEFDKSLGAPDYFLAEPYPVCSGLYLPTLTRPVGDYPRVGDMLGWTAQLHAFDPALAMYYSACELQPADAVQMRYLALRAATQLHADAALSSETAVPRLRDPLHAGVNLYAFRAAAGTELVGYINMPGSRLKASSDTASYSYDLNVLFAVGDPVTETVAVVDTAISFSATDRLGSTSLIGMAIPLVTRPAGRARVSLSIYNRNDPDQGQVLATSREIPDFKAETSISDIVVSSIQPGILRRGGHRLSPMAGHAVPSGSAFRVYAELYGLEADELLDVAVVIAPSADQSLLSRLQSLIARRAALSVDFGEAAHIDADGVARWEKEVTAELDPGSYVLTLTVTRRRSGQTVTAVTNLQIVDP
jgi:hypothetical protein